MTVRYCGPGGNNSNDGLSWANRKLTLNGVEDSPVSAGDVCYIAPGVYRELLTCNVSGTAGNPITYIGDVTGENTDGVGGVVRITGSDNDTTAARGGCITATSKNYRTFRGFTFDTISTGSMVLITTSTDWIVEDCVFGAGAAATSGVLSSGAGQARVTVRRCVFRMAGNNTSYGIQFNHNAQVTSAAHLVENCYISAPGHANNRCIQTNYVEGITVRNCALADAGTGLLAQNVSESTVAVNNCILSGLVTYGLSATTSGWVVENYNAFFNVATARNNVSTGANSNTYPPLWALPLLHAGQVLPAPMLGTLSEWSQVKRIAGTGEASDDLFGRTRPTTSAKKSWGAVQYQQPIRETTTTDASSAASLKLDDAGRVQFRVPVTATSTTISVKAYREADYAGTAPTMVIKQPGQSDRTTTDAGAASAWNTLTDTFTPAANPPYVVVELVSSNTATSGNYDTFFDTISVS